MQQVISVDPQLPTADFLGLDEVLRFTKSISTGSRRATNDPFFGSTNTLVGIEIVPGLRRLGVYPTIVEEHDLYVPTKNTVNSKTHCNVPGCSQVFDSIRAYDQHYSRLHRYQCAQCHRTFPSGHLLDLHLSEQHDSFFAANVSAHPDRPFYVCLLKECAALNVTPEARKDHCIREHSFPADFRFETKKIPVAAAAAPSVLPSPPGRIGNNLKNPQNHPPVHFVNFGHSKQKTFKSARHSDESEDYAKVLTKGQHIKSDRAKSTTHDSHSALNSDDLVMADLMDCLDTME